VDLPFHLHQNSWQLSQGQVGNQVQILPQNICASEAEQQGDFWLEREFVEAHHLTERRIY
jgi:hypothetical protein